MCAHTPAPCLFASSLIFYKFAPRLPSTASPCFPTLSALKRLAAESAELWRVTVLSAATINVHRESISGNTRQAGRPSVRHPGTATSRCTWHHIDPALIYEPYIIFRYAHVKSSAELLCVLAIFFILSLWFHPRGWKYSPDLVFSMQTFICPLPQWLRHTVVHFQVQLAPTLPVSAWQTQWRFLLNQIPEEP